MAKDNPDVFGYIYIVRNTSNDKVYVGQTAQSLKARWTEHLSQARLGSSSHFHNAIRKYGDDCFSMSLLATAASAEELDSLETKFIAEHQSTDKSKGYNICSGGCGTRGYVATDEHKAKVGVAAKQMWQDPAIRERILTSRQKTITDPEYKSKVRSIQREYYSDPAYKDKQRASWQRRLEDPDFRAEHVARVNATRETPEFRKNLSDGLQRFWQSPSAADAKAQASEHAKKLWADPATRTKMLATRALNRAKKEQALAPLLEAA